MTRLPLICLTFFFFNRWRNMKKKDPMLRVSEWECESTMVIQYSQHNYPNPIQSMIESEIVVLVLPLLSDNHPQICIFSSGH